MGGGKSSGGGDSVVTSRYAPYVEQHHAAFLQYSADAVLDVIDDSPFTGYVGAEVEDAFFGAGYAIASFPSLYDMFGKFMAGLDIEVLWEQEFEGTVNSVVVDNLVAAERDLLDDDIETTTLPRLLTGMRDINSALASSFVIGKAIVEDGKVKALAKTDAELRYKLIPVAEQRWQSHLQWNQQVVSIYAELMKFYYAVKHDVDEDTYSYAAKDKLWPFTVLDFHRANLGALQGAMTSKTDVAGASTASRVLSGALSGAAMGAMVGSQVGAASAGAGASSAQIAASSSSGAMWGGGVGAVLGIASALTY